MKIFPSFKLRLKTIFDVFPIFTILSRLKIRAIRSKKNCSKFGHSVSPCYENILFHSKFVCCLNDSRKLTVEKLRKKNTKKNLSLKR